MNFRCYKEVFNAELLAISEALKIGTKERKRALFRSLTIFADS